METYINAENLILGRMASQIAKRALLGEKIIILNSEKAVITGNRENIFSEYEHRRAMGNTSKGPFTPRMPDRFVRRAVRGMLPYKTQRGKDAFQRVMCYVGVPEEFKDKKMATLPNADISKLKNLKFIGVKEICAHLGGKI